MSAYQLHKVSKKGISLTTFFGVVCAGCSALAAVFAASQTGILSSTPVARARDPVTHCLTDVPLARHDFAAVDLTDRWSDSYLRDARAKISSIRDGLPPNGKLTIALVDPQNPYDPKVLFSRCSMGKPSADDTLTNTASYDLREWREDFVEPIEKVLDSLSSIPAAEPSPIIQSIAGIMWRGDFRAGVAERNLYVFSDLVQHDPKGYSQLRSGNSWRRYESASLFREATPDLRGVHVEILYINRPNWRWLQTPKHVALWERVFNRFGTAPVFIGAPSLTSELPVGQPLKPKAAAAAK